jgi:hypothetical protein
VTGAKGLQCRSDWMKRYKEKRRRWAPKTRRWNKMNREAALMEILDDMFWGVFIYRRRRWNVIVVPSENRQILLDNNSQSRENRNHSLEY